VIISILRLEVEETSNSDGLVVQSDIAGHDGTSDANSAEVG
jgi:hypothetical protein